MFQWESAGITGTGAPANDWAEAIPYLASLQQSAGHFNDPFSQFYTKQNRNSAIQFDQDIAFFKSGWLGTHNFKFGYQLNRLKNEYCTDL